MAALKDMFDNRWLELLATAIQNLVPQFDRRGFVKKNLRAFSDLELNDRMRHTSHILEQFLEGSYRNRVELLKKVVLVMPPGYTNLVFPDYISQYGRNEFHLSLEALHYFTRFGSSEFAIRHFLKDRLEETLCEMQKWAKDENQHVRRLASEGCRPRLPWSFQLDAIIRDPELTLPILHQLADDPSPYVRKSVANHLNDISKDHRHTTIGFVKEHIGQNPDTDKLLKHACRTLLKSGDPEVLTIFGTAHSDDLKAENFQISTPSVKIGRELEFSFGVKNSGEKAIDVRIEFAMYFLLLNGTHYRKVFKISERNLTPGTTTTIVKKFSFQPITTRVYRAGRHCIGIVINGVEQVRGDFKLVD